MLSNCPALLSRPGGQVSCWLEFPPRLSTARGCSAVAHLGRYQSALVQGAMVPVRLRRLLLSNAALLLQPGDRGRQGLGAADAALVVDLGSV